MKSIKMKQHHFHIITLIILFLTIYMIRPESSATTSNITSENQQIPFTGFKLTYRMYVAIDGIPFLPALLKVHYGDFQDSQNETITSTLNVIFDVGWIKGVENGTMVENRSSRLLSNVNVPPDGLLEAIYGDYFDQGVPNYTPFWIHPKNITIGSKIKTFNISLTVEDQNQLITDLGTVNSWQVGTSQINRTVQFKISFFYEMTTGVLAGGNLWINWKNRGTSYNETIHLIDTNIHIPTEENKRIAEAINRTWISIAIVALIPLVYIAIRLLKVKDIQGGLE